MRNLQLIMDEDSQGFIWELPKYLDPRSRNPISYQIPRPYYKGSFKGLYKGLGFPKIRGSLFGVLIIRILLFRVLYWDPLFSETPIWIYNGLQDFRRRVRKKICVWVREFVL